MLVVVAVVVNVMINKGGFSVLGSAAHTLDLSNESEYAISPGVAVVHSDPFLMSFLDTQAPAEYESLAEVGDPSAVIAMMKNNPSVYQVRKVGALEPGEQRTINFAEAPEDAVVSYMAMIVQTNDGVVWLDSFPLHHDEELGEQGDQIWVTMLDMGTEENSPIGSGFAGGQPDPARGAENVDNGTASTNGVVSFHSQFYEDDAISTAIVFAGINMPVEKSAGN